MSTYFSQALTISGDAETLSDFAERCLTKGEDGAWCGLDIKRIFPVPATLPGASMSTPFGNDVEVGVEALTGRPIPRIVDGIEVAGPSVFDRPWWRRRGIKTHAQLLAWLEKNRPAVIAVGRAAIESHAATGYWDRDGWTLDHWGEAEYLTDFAAEQDQPDKLVLRFETKGLPVSEQVRHLGRAFPALEFRLAGIDGDYEYPFVATAKGSAYRERKVKETKNLKEEVNKTKLDPTEYYRGREAAYPLRIWMPHHLLARARLRQHIMDYPVFRPPVLGLSYLMSAEQAQANFDHFLATRAERTDNLRRFLDRFDLKLDSTDEGLLRLDRWIEKYGPYLQPRVGFF